jgi:hypothetical protein
MPKLDIENMDVWELLPWDIQCYILSLLSIKNLFKLKRVSKSWQSIIASPTFCNLQFNTNSYENDIIIKLLYKPHQFIIKSLESTEFHYLDLKQPTHKFKNLYYHSIIDTTILGTNKGLILLEITTGLCSPKEYLVCNLATNEFGELPQLGHSGCGRTGDILVNLQSNTYDIFLLDYSNMDCLKFYIYNSLTSMWRPLDSFTKFCSSFQFEYFNSHILLFKEKLYAIFKTMANGLMVVVYDPMNDTWNILDMMLLTSNLMTNIHGRFVIANDRLFLVQTIYPKEYLFGQRYISIIQVKVEGSASFPIVKIERPPHRQCIAHRPEDYVYSVGNKIIISEYIQNFDIIYDVCTHKEVEKFVDKKLQRKCIESYHPLKYSLMSLPSKATSYRDR